MIFKSIQLKIMLIFFVVIACIITFIGTYTIGEIKDIYNNEVIIAQEQEANQRINERIDDYKLVLGYSFFAFLLISVLITLAISKTIVSPITKLTKSAEKIATGELKTTQSIDTDKKGNEIDRLVSAFNFMINELQKNIDEISRQKSQIETILLHMTDGIIAFDLQGEIIHINPAAKKLLKIKQNENNFDKIFKRLNVDINIEKIIYLENWTSSEQNINIKDTYINLFFAPFKDEKDKAGGVLVVIQDITEHVKLDNMTKEFVANVSHELKTPLTSIMGYSDTLMESEYDKQTEAKFLSVISSEAHRMARLVSDLLKLSKFDNRKIKFNKQKFDLGILVKRCQEKLQLQAEKKNQTIDCFVTADVPEVYADKDSMEQVVLNILIKSIKYTKEGGNIKIYVGFVYNDAYIKVIDNGIGIPEKDLDRVFDRFYRVDKARSREMGGTGLGLSIAKEMIEGNGGRINIKSKENKGTEVIISIPVKKE